MFFKIIYDINELNKKAQELKNGKYVSENGIIRYYKDGLLHNEYGPAFEDARGNKVWNLNGKLHREDGPACEYSDGDTEWWLNNKQYSEEDYYKELQRRLPIRDMDEDFENDTIIYNSDTED